MHVLVVRSQTPEVIVAAGEAGLELYEPTTFTVVEIASPDDLARIASVRPGSKVLMRFAHHKIIPMENALARHGSHVALYVEASDMEEAHQALGMLGTGVHGVVMDIAEPAIIEEMLASLETPDLKMVEATVSAVKPLRAGDRICIDTCDHLEADEGLLVGNTAEGMFLVVGEVEGTPFAPSRPFRVNAGALSLYSFRAPGQTCYLSELQGGSHILLVSHDGKTRLSTVARSKMERRPMVMIEALATLDNQASESKKADKRASTPRQVRIAAMIQLAETVKLASPWGTLAVTSLKAGDMVLVHLPAADASTSSNGGKSGRHQGTLVKGMSSRER